MAKEEKYDERNKLNDLTGKEWLKCTKSFYLSEKCADDKDAFEHPAPFLIKDIEKMISVFTKKNMLVLDPFMGSGTTAIASFNLGRKSIGIDLSEDYHNLALTRFEKKGMVEDLNYKYIVGDSLVEIENIPEVDYILTSPPYHNILKNDSKGLRKDSSVKGYRSGSRQGVEYYSDLANDLGNQNTYEEFLILFQKIMQKAYQKLKNKKYCSIIISDFTVDKKEICVQSDVVRIMEEIGFSFVGTIILLQDNKPLYPFGYPYAFKINHMHQNIINFRKEES
ncbi:putative DNA modification methylase [Coprobacillus sp. CAG:698]|nr:putative DNA modification methylase [Coprobacillus sp. CAG:698]